MASRSDRAAPSSRPHGHMLGRHARASSLCMVWQRQHHKQASSLSVPNRINSDLKGIKVVSQWTLFAI